MYKTRYYALQRAKFLHDKLGVFTTVRQDGDYYRVYIDTSMLIFGVDAMADDRNAEKKIIDHLNSDSLEKFYNGVIVNGYEGD